MFRDFYNRNSDPIHKSQAKYVEFGYGQVEPNHLSAQRTGQIYAQLPANPDIQILEQGQFVKYDYAANGNGIGEVNFTGKGEWMLVYNEIKLYRNHLDGSKQWDCEFAMLKDDYQARVYSPYDWEHTEKEYQTRFLNGEDANGATEWVYKKNVDLNRDGKTVTIDGLDYEVKNNKFTYEGHEYTLENGHVTIDFKHKFEDVTADVRDIYELNWTNDPYKKLGVAHEKRMNPGTSMVPRVFKTNVGDIMTTNMINEDTLAIGDLLTPQAGEGKGILAKTGADSADMKWQVVKIYTMPDEQKGVKIMRIA